MAIYHASFQVVKRSQGRSAVAAIAYRSGQRLIDERTGDIHDYSRKGGVADTFIVAPSYSPDWAWDRSKLWNEVELSEKRKDAQLARELNVALPAELSQRESKALLEAFVKTSFVDKGMVADVAMHEMDSDNPHAHIMLTMREIHWEEGFTHKNRDWNHKKQMIEWRHDWEKAVNHHLEVAGHDARIDHRSLKDQGIERAPTIHLGVHANALEKEGIATPRGDKNRAIRVENQSISVALAARDALDALIKKTKQTIEAARQLPVTDPRAVIDQVLGGRSVLSESLKRKDTEQAQEQERKEPRRSVKRSGPSHGH